MADIRQDTDVAYVPEETHVPQQLPACFEQETQRRPLCTAVKRRGNVVNPSTIA
jgi:hypothetical protein